MPKRLLGIISTTLFLVLLTSIAICQEVEIEEDVDAFFIKSLFDEALTSQNTYTILEDLLTYSGGHRFSGTANYNRAVEFANKRLKRIGFETIENQACEVPRWIRGEDDKVVYLNDDGEEIELNSVALGGSGHSVGSMIFGEVVAFDHIDSVATYRGDLEGKIAFFRRSFDQRHINTFRAYSGAVAQRVFGPQKAAERGMVATIVRSMSSSTDDHPHTGVTIFEEGTTPIPAMAISTIAADQLENEMAKNKVRVGVRCDAKSLDPIQQNTVVGQIDGIDYKEEIILAGAHLDSWDIGEGAHDDGAGCAHVLEAFRLLLEAGYKPKRTWRCVLFANEENGLGGAREYARLSNERGEFHLAAIESDAGGFAPQAFSFEADSLLPQYMKSVNRYWSLLEPYRLHREFIGSGADIGPLKSQGGLLVGLRPNPQRYFDYHHSTNDNLANVHPRELSLGAASIAALIYLIDKYGL